MGRRVTTRCTHEAGVREPWALYQVYANVGWPHASLRVPWRPLFPTHGTGSATPGRPRPPAMAAGLTERGPSGRCCSFGCRRGRSQWG